jgi:predicted porin
MREKLVVIAMASTLAVPAMAAVTVSGTMNVGPAISSATAGKAGSNPITTGKVAGEAKTVTNLHATYSFINFNSETELGMGTKAVMQYQIDVSGTGAGMDNLAAFMRNRDSFLGFAGSWGALKWGTNENVYEQYLYQADPLDGAAGTGGNLQMFGSPGYGVIFDNTSMGAINATNGKAHFYRRTDNSIWYESPDISGFSFGAGTTMPNAYKGGGQNRAVYSVGAQFKPANMPFYANVAYELHLDMFGLNNIVSTNGGNSSTDFGIKGQAGINLANLVAGVIVEQLSYEVDGATAFKKYTRLAIGAHAKYVLPKGYFGVNFGTAMKAKATSNTDVETTLEGSQSTYFAAGYFHDLAANVQFQGIVSYIMNGDNASYNTAASQANWGVNGVKQLAIYLGTKYSF